jgi:tetratricopeptide (TPR) repeat protein
MPSRPSARRKSRSAGAHLPAFPASPPYLTGARALLQLRETGEPSAGAEAVDELQRAVALQPDNAALHALLGYALDHLQGPATAIDSLRAATRLAPEEDLFEVYLLTLLAESDGSADLDTRLRSLAGRTRVDLDELAASLSAVGMPVTPRTLLQNGFVHARNHLASWLRDQVELAEQLASPADAAASGTRRPSADVRAAASRELAAIRRDLRKAVSPESVPAELHPLIPLAQRFGIGDDGYRGDAVERASPRERQALVRETEALAAAAQAWVGQHPIARMPAAAAAFMYLLLAAEEARILSSDR